MKRIISLMCMMIILFSGSATVLAGSVPEDLLHSDDAQIFFAEVVEYSGDTENPYIKISPLKIIKGDVHMGSALIYTNPNTVGDFDVKAGSVYLFTYLDENNPTEIFETTTWSPSTLKLKNTAGDMWDRFEKYLNDGSYEEAELIRAGKADAVEKLKNARTLADLFVHGRADIEQMAVVSPGDGDPAGCYIDKDKFFDMAEEIELLPAAEIHDLLGRSEILLMPQGNGDSAYNVSVDSGGNVGSQLSVASDREAEYKIGAWDYIRLRALLPMEAAEHLPVNIPRKYYIAAIAGAAVLILGAALIIRAVFKKLHKSRI